MMGECHKISVIVPVYNAEAYLRECVDSILGQTYQNIEVILVDDASTDGSGRICDDYEQADRRVCVIHKENGGPGSACVAGMNEALGDYYMFVDSDDYVEPEMLTEMAAHLAGQPGEIVCCNHLREKQKKTEPVYSAVAPGVYQGEELESVIKARLVGRQQRILPMSRCMKLCEKTVFEGNEKYYDYRIRFAEDSNMMYPALLNSTRIVVMEGALYYHYRYVESSMIHAYDKGIYDSLQRVMACMRRAASDKQVPDGAQAVDRENCYMLLYVMKNELRNPDAGYRARIREIFGSGENRELFRNIPLPVSGKKDTLLYLAARHPEGILPVLLRMAIRLYDRKKR